MNSRALRRGALALSSAVLLTVLAGCSSSSGNLGSTAQPSSTPSASATTPSTDTPTSVPTATAGGEVVAYQGTIGTGVAVKGKTQSEPTVVIAKGAPKPTSLITSDLVIGTGATATASSNVTVSYVGVNFSTGKVFNNTYPSGQTFTINLSQVIDGWKQGIPGMKVGGVRGLSIPAALAYGSAPPDPSVAGPLVFVVELQSIS